MKENWDELNREQLLATAQNLHDQLFAAAVCLEDVLSLGRTTKDLTSEMFRSCTNTAVNILAALKVVVGIEEIDLFWEEQN
jgi:hypothetical protein